MNTKGIFKSIGVLLLATVLLSSCTSSKRTAVACPKSSKRQMYSKAPVHSKSYAYKVNQRKDNNKSQYSHTKNFLSLNIFDKKISGKAPIQETILSTPKYLSEITPLDSYSQPINEEATHTTFLTSNIPTIGSSSNIDLRKLVISNKSKIFMIDQQNECDIMVLLNGEEIEVKIIEIGLDEIKYKKCENLEGPVIAIRKSEVLMIKYPNGTKDVISTPYTTSRNEIIKEQKSEELGIIAFIAGIGGLFIAGIILGAGAIVLGAASLSKIKRQPERYKGRGLAIGSITIGIIDIVGVLLFLSMM